MGSCDPRPAPTRRDVITGATAAGIAAGIVPLTRPARGQSDKPPHVVIVGAGLAGLCTAYRLQQSGWTYTILEAERNHVGGRVRTMPIGNDLYWEAGAMRIPGNHKTTLKYVDELGLRLQAFVMSSRFLYARGRREHADDEAKLRDVYKLAPGEKDKSAEDLWKVTVHGPRDRLTAEEKKELNSANAFTSETLMSLDRLSLRQLIEQARLSDAPLSQEAIEYLLFGSGNLTLQHSACTEFLREELNDVWSPPFFQVVGGNSRFPEAFVAKLSTAPKMGCEVIRIEQDPSQDRVNAVYRSGDRLVHEQGDFLVCTVPLSVLARIDIEPSFTGEKRRTIRDFWYEPATKLVALTRERFWETDDHIYGGTSATDLMTGSIVYPSDNAPENRSSGQPDASVSRGPGVLVMSYAWGQDARRLGAMTATEREGFALSQASKIHAQLGEPGMVLQTASWAWDSYRWAGGAFAWYMPGQFTSMHRDVIAPEGRIYFAGEHCSHSHSWMQGALESAESVTAALLARGR
jgi:monoamine oxidase